MSKKKITIVGAIVLVVIGLLVVLVMRGCGNTPVPDSSPPASPSSSPPASPSSSPSEDPTPSVETNLVSSNWSDITEEVNATMSPEDRKIDFLRGFVKDEGDKHYVDWERLDEEAQRLSEFSLTLDEDGTELTPFKDVSAAEDVEAGWTAFNDFVSREDINLSVALLDPAVFEKVADGLGLVEIRLDESDPDNPKTLCWKIELVIGLDEEGEARRIDQISEELGAPNGNGLAGGFTREQLDQAFGKETTSWSDLYEIVKVLEPQYGDSIDWLDGIYGHGLTASKIAEWATAPEAKAADQLAVMISGGDPISDKDARRELDAAYTSINGVNWDKIPIFRVDPAKDTEHNSYWNGTRTVPFADVRRQVRLVLVPLVKAEDGSYQMDLVDGLPVAWIGSDCRNRFDLTRGPAPMPRPMSTPKPTDPTPTPKPSTPKPTDPTPTPKPTDPTPTPKPSTPKPTDPTTPPPTPTPDPTDPTTPPPTPTPDPTDPTTPPATKPSNPVDYPAPPSKPPVAPETNSAEEEPPVVE